jgi:hypothetical protein
LQTKKSLILRCKKDFHDEGGTLEFEKDIHYIFLLDEETDQYFTVHRDGTEHYMSDKDLNEYFYFVI